MKKTLLNFKIDGRYKAENIIGNIKKIFIMTEKPMQSVSITFTTNEQEVIYEVKQKQNIIVIYPYNFIDNQGRGTEYYSEGDLFIDILGLVNEEEIKEISIFYR